MAEGDLRMFNQARRDIFQGLHDFDNDTFKIAFIDSTVTPAYDDANPRFGAGSGVDYDANEVSGGNVPAGGVTLASMGITVDDPNDDITIDCNDVTIASAGGNPSTARWAIIYNDTATNKNAVWFLDLGSVTDMTAGQFQSNWNADGLHQYGTGTLT